MKSKITLVLFAFLTFLNLQGNEIYVKKNAAGSNDGTSWSNAYTELTDALGAAIKGDIIYVAAGTYTPDASSRTNSFVLQDSVYVYGGFVGNETPINESVLAQRDFIGNLTVLSGDLSDNDNGFSNNTENSYNVVKITDVDTALLDGFLIRGGNSSNDDGGGIYLQNSNPVLKNLMIAYNYAYYKGGGIYCDESSPYIINSVITNNRGEFFDGGGLYNYYYSSPILINTIIWNNNYSTNQEVYNSFISEPEFSHCIVGGSGGSENWNEYYGVDNGNNFDASPLFEMVSTFAFSVLNKSIALNNGDIEYGKNIGVYQGDGVSAAGIFISDNFFSFLDKHVDSVHIDSFYLAGYDLSGDVNFQTEEPFGISLEKSNFATSLVVQPDGTGNIDSTIVYVNFYTQSSGSYWDKLIEISSSGVDQENIAIEGRGVSPKVWIYQNETILNDTFVNVPSQEKTVTIDADYLLGDLSIEVNPPFQITKTSGDYSGDTENLVFNPVDGEINDVFYIRLLSENKGVFYDTIYLSSKKFEPYNPTVKGVAYSETPEVVYVKQDATGSNDGTSWQDAFTDLQDGLRQAVFGDTLLVARGHYTPDSINDDISFEINNGIKLIGGLNGDETVIDSNVLANRDFYKNETRLSGYLSGEDNQYGINSYNVLKTTNCDSTTVIDGVTVKGGEYGKGCGIYNENSDVIFRFVKLTDNYTSDFEDGILYNYNSNPTFINLTISNNRASAISYEDITLIYNENSNPVFLNTIIAENSYHVYNADEYVVYNENSYPEFSYCLIENSGGSSSWDNTLGTDNGFNIEADPRFIDYYTNDVRLWEDSPAISAGDTVNAKNIGLYLGDGLPYPTLTKSENSYNFNTVKHDEITEETSFTLKGENLLSEVMLVAPDNVEISLTSGEYSGVTDTIILSLEGDSLPTTTIYLRFYAWKYDASYFESISISTLNEYESFSIWADIPKPTLWYVKESATGKNGGGSWQNAFNGLQSALGVAEEGDTIVVAKGTYKPSTASRSSSFLLVDGVKMFGGFMGDETSFDESTFNARDWMSNPSILSGDLNDDDESGIKTDNSYNVVRAADNYGFTNETLLDGFVISGGQADFSNDYRSRGGGLMIYGGGLADSVLFTVKNIIFENNYARDGGALAIDGVINSDYVVKPLFENIIFRNNKANYGAAVRLSPGTNNTFIPRFFNVLFHDNYATYAGGGIYNSAGNTIDPGKMTLSVQNATFYNNTDGLNSNYNLYSINQNAGGKIVTKLTNVIMWDDNNVSKYITSSTLNDDSVFVYVDHSLIKGSGGSDSWLMPSFVSDSGFNIAANPIFSAPEKGNFNLVEGSPAIGSGNSAYGENMGYYQGSGTTPPNITINQTMLDFGSVDLGTYSDEQNYVLSGSNLYGDMLVVAPDNFEISLTSNDYSGNTKSVVVPKNEGSASDTVYVRFVPETAGDIEDSITNETSSVFKEYLEVTGSGNPIPFIQVNTDSLNFEVVNTSFYSDILSFTVSGIYLTDDIIITSSNEDIELSTEGIFENGITDTVVLEPSSGNVDVTTIFVRLLSDSVGYINDSLLLKTEGGATRHIAIAAYSNMYPEISDISNVSICTNQQQVKIPFTINDDDLNSINVSASVYPSWLIPADSIKLEGEGKNWSIELKPTAFDPYDASVTITVYDNFGGIVNTYFEFSITDKIVTFTDIELCAGDSLLFNGAYLKEGGIFSDTLQATGGCDSISNINLIFYSQHYTDLGEDRDITTEQEVYLDAGVGSTHYNWSNNPTLNFYAQNIQGSELGVGTHTISVEVTNDFGCSNSDTVIINVTSTSDIENISDQELTICPVPAKQKLYIKSKQNQFKDAIVEVYTLSGKRIINKQFSFEIEVIELDMSNIKPGLYNLRIIENKDKVYNHKIVKE